jgi:RimJ/RimL family protein N-acetyltransferase
MGQLHHPEPRLTDGVVTLRPWEDGDVDFVVRACRDERVSRYSPSIAFPYVEADARDWFAGQEPMRLEGTALDLAIVDAQSGAALGAIALVNFSWRDGRAETGYWLAQEARGHGYVTRAVRLLVRWGFDELQLQRIELKADPQNLESQRVAERCGFSREGHLRSHTVVLHSGERRDSLIYGLLPGELR